MSQENMLESALQVGRWYVESGKMMGVQTEAQGAVLALSLMKTGMSEMEFASKYHVIQGKLRMRAEVVLGEFKARGGKVKWLKFTDKIASAIWTAKDEDPVEISYTIEDAIKSGVNLNKDRQWIENPDAQLRARLNMKAARMVDPEVLYGTYSPEEMGESADQADDIRRRTEEAMAGADPEKLELESAKPAAPLFGAEPEPEKPSEVEQVVALLQPVMVKAMVWMKEKEWLVAGQDLVDLEEKYVHAIVSQPEQFLAEIEKGEGK